MLKTYIQNIELIRSIWILFSGSLGGSAGQRGWCGVRAGAGGSTVRRRDATRGCGCGFGENPPAVKPAGLEKTRPRANPRVQAFLHPHPRISGGFRVPAGLTTDIIKMYKIINLNSQITHFYK